MFTPFVLAAVLLAGQAIAAVKTLQPVLKTSFADPSLIQVNGTYYSFATSGNNVFGIQIAKSQDFKTWEYLKNKDALPHTGDWVNQRRGEGHGVAPDVQQMVSPPLRTFYSRINSLTFVF